MTHPLAQAAMVAYCGWDPTEVVTNRMIRLSGTGARLLTLPSLYVTDVSAVVVTDDWGVGTSWAVGPAPASIGWSEDGTLTYRGCAYSGFPRGVANIAVTYSGGYAEVPADLQAALDSMAKRIDTASAGVRSKAMGNTSFTYFASGDLLAVEKLVLNRYRIIDAH